MPHIPVTVQGDFPNVRCSLMKYQGKHRNPKTRRKICEGPIIWDHLLRCLTLFGREQKPDSAYHPGVVSLCDAQHSEPSERPRVACRERA